jgi:hypothetical protein
MATRIENERRFPNWEQRADGGRRYWREVAGRRGWRARYVKVVDRDEETISFVQEVYNHLGKLVEVHEEFPVDTGHRKIEDDER